MRNFLKHTIVVLVIAGAILGAYVLLTLPILGVLFIDDEMGSFSDLLLTYLMMGGISLGVSCSISLLNIFFTFLSKSYKVFKWIVPFFFILVINCIAIIYVWIYYADYVFGWVLIYGIFFYFSLLFLLYRFVERGIGYLFSLLERSSKVITNRN